MLSIRYKPSMPVSFEVGVIVLAAPPGDFIPSLPLRLSQCLLYRVKRLCVLCFRSFRFTLPWKLSFLIFIAKSCSEGKGLDAHWLLLLSFKAAFEAVLPVV